MAFKNIIVCADGTGNKGGYSPDSNVYRVYNAVDKNFSGNSQDGVEVSEQLIFYDNGVGTSKNKYIRAIGGAIGLGFGQNVRDLYKYLARNYVEGDRIYFFGFSRGASTVRACNGMINKCGLAKGADLRNRDLEDLVNEAFSCYKCHKKEPVLAENFKNSNKSHGAVPIHFLGIWDTVVALGFPKRTDITDPLMYVLNYLFLAFENVLDFFWPHSFYHYKLTDNVEFACQALSIDDERTAFWPFVWREKNIEGAVDRTADNVEQVWFAGMHSNVGGGYERAGIASVALHWMVNRAHHHGLVFDTNDIQDIISDCHIHGRMYNSRDGFGFFYRYHPREIEKLCSDRLLGKIKVHCSVIERMGHRTANYTPGYIPADFEVVDSAVPSNVTPFNPGSNDQWAKTRELIDKTVKSRKRLYSAMVAVIIIVIAASICIEPDAGQVTDKDTVAGKVADVLYTVLPDYFNGLINLAFIEQSLYLLLAIILIGLYLKLRKSLYDKTVSFCETLRHYVINAAKNQISCGKGEGEQDENT